MNALTIGEQPIREIMIPADDIVALSTAVDPEENLDRIETHPHIRYPLVSDTITEFHGVVYVLILTRYREELVDGTIGFTEIAVPPMTLSPDVDQFQTESQELALVIEDGEGVDIVTVTDLLEAVMGSIKDTIDIESIQDRVVLPRLSNSRRSPRYHFFDSDPTGRRVQ